METSFSKNKELKAKDCALGDIFELLQIDVDLEPTSANGVDMNCSVSKFDIILEHWLPLYSRKCHLINRAPEV